MAQTTWGSQATAYAGMLADADKCYVRSYVNEEAVAVPFGVGLVQGTLDTDALLPSAANASLLGIVAHSHAYDNQALAGSDGIAVNAVANVVVRGPIYVAVEEAVAPGDPVFCRFTTGTGTQKGAFRRSSDSGTAFRVAGARWLTSAAAAGFAVLYLPGIILASDQIDPCFAESFGYGAAKGLAILQADGTPYDATAAVHNVMQFGSGNKIMCVPIVGQTIPPAMVATGLDIQGDQVDNDGFNFYSNNFLATGRPLVIGDDPAFYFKLIMEIALADGTDECHVGFRRAEAPNATIDNYLDMAALCIEAATSPALLHIETILNGGGTTTTDTTDTLADATEVEFTILVSAAGVVTYLIDGAAPSATAAFTFDDGDPVIPFLDYLQANAAQTGAFVIKHWEVGYQ